MRMDKEPRLTWRWHKERLPVAAAMFICILLEFLFAACAEITHSSLFIWSMLAVTVVMLVLALVVLPHVISKEKAREEETQANR